MAGAGPPRPSGDAAAILDASAADRPSAAADIASVVKGAPIFVAVGYAGRRIRSRDLGLTWENDQTLGGGGDDQYLLRAVGWANGIFVAVGWKIVTSPDGAVWTEQKNPQNQWLGGVQFGNGHWAAVGGYGYSAWSMDGITWMRGAARGTEAARSLGFGDGKFLGATDPGNWWVSTDAQAWKVDTGGHSSRVMYCVDSFKDAAMCTGPSGRNGGRTALGNGVYVSARGSAIERSTDGTTWRTVHMGGASFEGVTVGYAP